MFHDELDLLRWRIEELRDVVDFHVIVEATRTFSGESKPLWFDSNRSLFLDDLHRIRHVVVENMPDHPVGTHRMYETERIQRNAILRGLHDAEDGDWVAVSDADEIPRASTLADCLLNRQGVALLQDCYYYFLNLFGPEWSPWPGTRVTRAGNVRVMSPQQVRVANFPGAPYGGWHFSFFGGTAQMQRKLRSWSHVEWNRPPMNTVEHLRSCLQKGLDWDATRNAKLEWRPLQNLPQYVVANFHRYSRYVGDAPCHK